MSHLTTTGIVAAYNQDAYVEDAVRHLASQVDEVIVVNDASSDRTREVLDSLNYSNLRVIHNVDQLGVSDSYNRAVDMATSDLLLIQGGDDVSLPNRAQAQREALADSTVSMVFSLPVVIDSRGRELPPFVAGEFLTDGPPVDPLARLFFGSNYICAPAVAIRRVDYLAHGGFRRGLDLLQDYALWLELAAAGRFVVVESPVVKYRKHASNLSREYVGLDSANRRRFAAEMEFIRSRFLEMASGDVLMRLAGHLNLDLEWFSHLDREEKAAIIAISHGDKLVFRHGVRGVFEIAGAANGRERLRKLGLSLGDLSTLSVRADHENLAEVSGALAATKSIARLSPERTKRTLNGNSP